MTRVVLFEFAGRKANLELQLPILKRIAAENDNVDVHLWNLAREPSDNVYLRSLGDGDGIAIFHNLHCRSPMHRMGDVYKYYAHQRFKGRIFVKIDDDVVFAETAKFAQFVSAVENDEHNVIYSAQVVNNGACTALEPGLQEAYEALDIPLLDVHMHCSYAEMAHSYMFEHWREMVDRPVEIVPIENWLSINLIGYNWRTGCQIVERLGRPAPRYIADRQWSPRVRIGDEGAANFLPRKVMKGFVAAHLSFGPQKPTPDQLTLWLKKYREIGRQYQEMR